MAIIKMDKDQYNKAMVVILLILLTSTLLFYGTYLYGAKSVCENSNGHVIKKDGELRCVDLENTDICKTDMGNEQYLLEHKEEKEYFNWS